MKILIYGLNFLPELTGIGKYTGEMAEWLAKQDHNVRVITTPPYYPAWKISYGYSAWRYTKETAGNITIFRCPLWVPEKPKTITRLIHLLSFSISSIPVLFKQIFWGRPDAVVCIAPSFFCAPLAVLFCKLSGVKSWLHFQDFEICAMFGTGMFRGGQTINGLAHSLQRRVTRRFDVVSTISHAMCMSADGNRVSRGQVNLFPNWVDLEFISPAADAEFYRQRWNIPANTMVALYSGNLGKKQGLEIVVAVAKILRNRKDILFVIVGDGAHKETLLKEVEDARLTNIRFYPLQPYEQLPALLRFADIHLVIQKKGAADSVLPSKLTSILAAGGHAIITAEPVTELGRLVEGNLGIASLIPPEDASALAEAITRLAATIIPGHDSYNKIARNYAVTNLGRRSILSRFENDLKSLVGHQPPMDR